MQEDNGLSVATAPEVETPQEETGAQETTNTSTTVEPTEKPNGPTIEYVEGKIVQLQELRDKKIKDANEEARSTREAIDARCKEEMKDAKEAAQSYVKRIKEEATQRTKNAVSNWKKVLRNLKKREGKPEAADAATETGAPQ